MISPHSEIIFDWRNLGAFTYYITQFGDFFYPLPPWSLPVTKCSTPTPPFFREEITCQINLNFCKKKNNFALEGVAMAE
jgi:hypothetical protein